MADDGLDYGTPFQPAFDLVGHSAFLAGDVNRSAPKSQAMSFVSLIDRDTPRSAPDNVPNIFQGDFQRVTIVGISVQRPRLQNEVSTGCRMQIGGDGNFAAEFVRGARFSLADAFHLGGVPGIEIPGSPRF
jgi:hypothetical protein